MFSVYNVFPLQQPNYTSDTRRQGKIYTTYTKQEMVLAMFSFSTYN